MSRVSSALILVIAASMAPGCAALMDGSKADLTNTASSLKSPEFSPPNDPGMGQIAIAIPEVILSAPGARGIGDLPQTVRTQLTNSLAACPNFLVADRESLGAISEEHRLADSGAVNPADTPARGQLIGARYIVKVDVTELQERVLGKSEGGRFELGNVFGVLDHLVGGQTFKKVSGVMKSANPTIGGGTETIEGLVGLELRVVDVDTGTVAATTRAQARVTAKNSRSILGIAGLSTTSSEFSQSVLAHATRAAAENATVKLHAAMKRLVSATHPAPRAVLAQGEHPGR